MDRKQLIKQIRAVAQYIKATHAPIGEKTLIERLLTGALTLEDLAKELEEAEEAENAPENQQGE